MLVEPSISIITVVLNNRAFLEKTIRNVMNIDYPNFEFIVIDGGSTDGTLDVIKKYENNIDRWVSEADEGISDAFNKGLNLSSGEWINFLNAGDTYTSHDVLKYVMQNRDKHSAILTAFSQHNDITIPQKALSNSQPLPKKSMISHQASFVKREVFADVGNFSNKYEIRMDYDFWLRALSHHEFQFIEKTLVNYHAGKSSENLKLFYKEEIMANNEHLTMPLLPNLKAIAKSFLKTSLMWQWR